MTTLQDRFGRSIDYLRLSVTDRCDLRCSYCIPKGFKDFEEPENWLTFDEIERVVAAFARLGTRRVRLTGGEPLLRRNLPKLAARLSALPGLEDLRSVPTPLSWRAMHANCTRLVKRVNVSLDSLRRECVNSITGRDSLPQVMAACRPRGCRPCSDQDQYGGNERCK
jgi:cyclic pyranopterin phosphate synthase